MNGGFVYIVANKNKQTCSESLSVSNDDKNSHKLEFHNRVLISACCISVGVLAKIQLNQWLNSLFSLIVNLPLQLTGPVKYPRENVFWWDNKLNQCCLRSKNIKFFCSRSLSVQNQVSKLRCAGVDDHRAKVYRKDAFVRLLPFLLCVSEDLKYYFATACNIISSLQGLSAVRLHPILRGLVPEARPLLSQLPCTSRIIWIRVETGRTSELHWP